MNTLIEYEAASALFAKFAVKPVWAVQITTANAKTLSVLDGIKHTVESDTGDFKISIRVADGLSQLIEFGDWIVSTEVPGRWVAMAPSDNQNYPTCFDSVYQPTSDVDASAVESALRHLISDIDYDTHKSIEADEETGEDGYPELTESFIDYYGSVQGNKTDLPL